MILDRLQAALRSPLVYLAAALVVSLILFAAGAPDFLTARNLKDVAAGSAALGVIALGVSLALAAGAIDFSIAGTAALVGIVVARVDTTQPAALALLAGLAVALAIGLLNGLVVVRLGVNAFIATLAAGGAYRGIAYMLAGSSVGVILPNGLIKSIGLDGVLGIPDPAWVLAAAAAGAYVALRHTRFGRGLLAVGGNAEAARLAGLPAARMQVAGYVIAAVFAGAGGVLLAGRSTVAIPAAASGSELLVFSMVLLGGTSLWGGRASVVGTLLGVLFLNVLYNGLVLERVSSYWQTILQGALLILAVWLVQAQREGRDPAALLRRALRSPPPRSG
jgi:ribose transport system permease protein